MLPLVVAPASVGKTWLTGFREKGSLFTCTAGWCDGAVMPIV
jgi:hypothetical protein